MQPISIISPLAGDARLETDYSCSYPADYTLDTGNVCNLRCPGCPTGKHKSGLARGLLSYTDFLVILSKISMHAKRISLFSWGEPWMNKALIPIISRCAEQGIRTNIHTNLSFSNFTNEDAENLVNSGLTHLVAAVDGATQDAYQMYRRGGDIQQVLRNLTMISEANQRHPRSPLRISWKYLINGYNESEMDLAREMADAMGIEILFKPMDLGNWADDGFKRKNVAKGKRKRAPEDAESSPVATADKPVAAEMPQGGNAAIQLVDLKIAPSMIQECAQPFSNMHIHWNGEVFPCCNVHGDEYSLGNLLTGTLEEVWNGLQLKRCREYILNYGSVQNTLSVCETLPCPVAK